jgi:transcriptional regulator with PAS, ATPase and Fis domain
MDLQQIKQRFGIIGNSVGLNRAIDIAVQVASTDLSVLITGESGTGKEIFPQIIHLYGSRKHGQYIAVNCGAIPEGTIDSELFGHEKGSFTGAIEKRKGYFDFANNGTIFLDEVAELPLSTQVRLLRVLETGEFMSVGSSIVHKTNVRVIAATNINILEAVQNGKFREDLYYRLNTVPIFVPPLRNRKEDIILLFKKFAQDFAERYRMPVIKLTENAQVLFQNYDWPGNIRQLKNITEQISVIEKTREINADILQQYIPDHIGEKLPALYRASENKAFNSERDILYQILFDMKRDMNDLKKLVLQIIDENIDNVRLSEENNHLVHKLFNDNQDIYSKNSLKEKTNIKPDKNEDILDTEEFIEESLSLQNNEHELIKKALEKYHGKRKLAAQELGISERTLYRKIKEYNIY